MKNRFRLISRGIVEEPFIASMTRMASALVWARAREGLGLNLIRDHFLDPENFTFNTVSGAPNPG